MPPDKRPFRSFRGEQVPGHGHFTTSDVGTQRLDDTAERQVPYGSERRDVDLVAEVDGFALVCTGWVELEGVGAFAELALKIGRDFVRFFVVEPRFVGDNLVVLAFFVLPGVSI